MSISNSNSMVDLENANNNDESTTTPAEPATVDMAKSNTLVQVDRVPADGKVGPEEVLLSQSTGITLSFESLDYSVKIKDKATKTTSSKQSWQVSRESCVRVNCLL